MATITLAEASKLGLDDLVTGVIENIVDVNPIYAMLPFQDISGNAKTYNRENVLGDTQTVGIDGTITAKAAASYTKVTSSLTTIIGDAEVNGLLQAQQVGGDIAAAQISSKAKQVGRHFQHLFLEGDPATGLVAPTAPKFANAASDFEGIRSIISGLDAGQTITSAAGISYEDLDEMLQAVKSKDGQVDAMCMSPRTMRAYRALLRAQGGATAEYVEVAGVQVLSYSGVPIFRNDYIPTDIDNSAGTGTTTDSYVIAMNFDDGSEKVGVCGLTSALNMGIQVQNVGAAETKDNDIFRVKFYSSMAVYSGLSVAMLEEVSN